MLNLYLLDLNQLFIHIYNQLMLYIVHKKIKESDVLKHLISYLHKINAQKIHLDHSNNIANLKKIELIILMLHITSIHYINHQVKENKVSVVPLKYLILDQLVSNLQCNLTINIEIKFKIHILDQIVSNLQCNLILNLLQQHNKQKEIMNNN